MRIAIDYYPLIVDGIAAGHIRGIKLDGTYVTEMGIIIADEERGFIVRYKPHDTHEKQFALDENGNPIYELVHGKVEIVLREP